MPGVPGRGEITRDKGHLLETDPGSLIHEGNQPLLEMLSESERCPSFSYLPSFALQTPSVYPIGKTQLNPANLRD